MTTPGLGGYGFGIGAGYAEAGADSVLTIGHSGGINGFSSQLTYFPESERTVVVLDNTQGPSGDIARGLAKLLHGLEPDAPRRPLASVLMPVIDGGGVEAGVAHYRALKASEPESVDFDEGQLNALGYAYLGRGDTETAIRLFELNVEAYPDAWNVYDSLGEAQLAAGDTARATANYQRAFDLNPAAPSARTALEELGVLEAAPEMALPGDVLERYVGRYELQPGFVIAVTREGAQLSGPGHRPAGLRDLPDHRDRLLLQGGRRADRVRRGGGRPRGDAHAPPGRPQHAGPAPRLSLGAGKPRIFRADARRRDRAHVGGVEAPCRYAAPTSAPPPASPPTPPSG